MKEGHCEPRRINVGSQWPLFPLCCRPSLLVTTAACAPTARFGRNFPGWVCLIQTEKVSAGKRKCWVLVQPDTNWIYFVCTLVSTLHTFYFGSVLNCRTSRNCVLPKSFSWIILPMSQLVLLILWIKKETEVDPVLKLLIVMLPWWYVREFFRHFTAAVIPACPAACQPPFLMQHGVLLGFTEPEWHILVS